MVDALYILYPALAILFSDRLLRGTFVHLLIQLIVVESPHSPHSGLSYIGVSQPSVPSSRNVSQPSALHHGKLSQPSAIY
jgi:hypothetical protein